MSSRGANVLLKPLDDLFETDASREEAKKETVQEIALSELHPFKDHPFKILDDEAMDKTVESVREFGVLTPAIVRPRDEGGYEIVAPAGDVIYGVHKGNGKDRQKTG